MKKPEIPSNEKERLAELKSYEILDTALEQRFDDITKIAAFICETPISLVSLIDKDRQWFKSRHGLNASETPRDLAYCAHAIHTPEDILEVPDAYEDERFYDNPLATGDPHVRFYAGAPLVSSNGYSLGTLCVIDHEPKTLSDAQREALWALSRQVTALLELRKTNLHLEESKKEQIHAEKTFRDRIERIGDMVYELNTEGYFIYVNPALVRESGFSEKQLLEMHFSDLVDSGDAERVSKHYIDILKNHTRSSYLEFKMKGANGPCWVGQTVEIEFQDDVGVRTFGVARNISERRKYDEAIQEAMQLAEKAKQEAIESAKAKENFLSTMSHEIRTPLNAILGVTNLLLMEELKKEHLEHLNLLKFSGENLLCLINDILDYNKIESGKVELEKAEFNLKEILTALKQSLAPEIGKKGLEMTFMYDETLPQRFIGDSVRITQIINNLLSNAIKFTDEGFIKLSVTQLEKRGEEVQVHFEVHDSGIGIEKANQSIIFENFEQASDDTTRKFGGTGLGLAISKKLLQLMDSQIELDSALGFGSIFSFDLILPIGNQKSPESNEKFVQPEFDNLADLKIHILVAEDNRANQIVLEKFLVKWGIKMEFVENGRLALERSKTELYDLILMDLQMPEMDGYQATKAIRKLNSVYAQNLPIVALTASALLHVRKKVKELGMTDYITKPFDPEELYKKILKYRGKVMKKHAVSTDHPIGLKLLKLADNDQDFVKELAEHYLEIYQNFLSDFLEAMDNADEKLIKQTCDSIKTSNEVLGISSLPQLMNEVPRILLEKGNKKGQLIEKIKKACEEITAALRHIMSISE
ncbi:PAS domain S-box-containing protein [Reichenbachiella faecimaris]|uniref:histidine kinase n=1 Tax=Reichenbachiella faecimaris TaxID=692418 RepID=A0A1W2GAI5_REIFA|nr:response regulator [Reichenbachiella faecimaris]SMD33680.1 PAS domain S-box-containing protein [Reichenbachiella faecimaris]